MAITLAVVSGLTCSEEESSDLLHPYTMGMVEVENKQEDTLEVIVDLASCFLSRTLGMDKLYNLWASVLFKL